MFDNIKVCLNFINWNQLIQKTMYSLAEYLKKVPHISVNVWVWKVVKRWEIELVTVCRLFLFYN